MNNSPADRPEPTYRIGAVARLTGVAPDTLRVWERRHGAVVPFRSPKGSRLYSQRDCDVHLDREVPAASPGRAPGWKVEESRAWKIRLLSSAKSWSPPFFPV